MLLSELEFGAFLAYSPRGQSDVARESKNWCRSLKDEALVGRRRRPMSRFVVERLVARLPEMPFRELFAARPVLVPVPKSSLAKASDLWVPQLLARELVRADLGADVLPCLRRRHAVLKSASAVPSDRARPIEHYESLTVERVFPAPGELLLIDDVVTRGSTLLGSASRLREAFPAARVRAFVIVRTISNPDEFVAMLAPVIGQIELRGDNAFRRP